MTELQKNTVRQIIKEYVGSFEKNRKKIIHNGEEIFMPYILPNYQPRYKEIEGGKILFGIGEGFAISDSYIVEFNDLKIININGEIIAKEEYNDSELELIKNPIVIDMFNMREDLLPFDF
jgi:hypothetical protein